jgi:hypothetical protein
MDNNYEKYLEEKFNGLNQKLDFIKEQTLKTNGRVNDTEHKLERLSDRVDAAIKYGNHVIDTRSTNCPNVEVMKNTDRKIEDLKKSIEDITFFNRHPKLMVGIIVVLVVLSLATFLENNPFHIFYDEPVKIESTE